VNSQRTTQRKRNTISNIIWRRVRMNNRPHKNMQITKIGRM
jgi:hypothetical protein